MKTDNIHDPIYGFPVMHILHTEYEAGREMCWGIWEDIKGEMEDTYDNILLYIYEILKNKKLF